MRRSRSRRGRPHLAAYTCERRAISPPVHPLAGRFDDRRLGQAVSPKLQSSAERGSRRPSLDAHCTRVDRPSGDARKRGGDVWRGRTGRGRQWRAVDYRRGNTWTPWKCPAKWRLLSSFRAVHEEPRRGFGADDERRSTARGLRTEAYRPRRGTGWSRRCRRVVLSCRRFPPRHSEGQHFRARSSRRRVRRSSCRAPEEGRSAFRCGDPGAWLRSRIAH